MKLILSHIFNPFYFLFFGLLLLIFHPIQFLSLKLGGYTAHKKTVDLLNFFLVQNFKTINGKVRFSGFEKIPKNRPLIIISNHQSNFDIPSIAWGFRKFHPKYISKIELSKGLPSVSFNLKYGGSAIIDRKNARQSIREIATLGNLIENNKYAACIFPEGTRGKNGRLKTFKESGIKTLLKAAPSAIIVPYVICCNYRLLQYGNYPLAFGEKLRYQVLDPIEPASFSVEELINEVENQIRLALNQ
jgi:1-acyl-sn-glycerol-3-phosphate acyltransferase